MDKINLKYPASKIDELLIKIDSQNFNNYLLNTGGILKGRYYLGLNAEISNNSGGRILGHDGLSTTIIGNAGGILNLEAVGLNVRVSNGLSSYRVLTEADKGINIVPLDSYGKISSQYLPSSVDDIVEVTSTNDLKTITGERGKIYVTLDTNITYRWSGTQFVEISKSLGLGTNENEAYPGNLGAANATSINNLTATVGTHSSDISTLKSTVGSHTNSLSSITSTLQSVNQSIINQGTTIGEHTQHITDLNNSKLGKTEKAADSAKLGGVAASGYAQLSGAKFTGLLNASTVFRVNASAEVHQNCIAIRAETVGPTNNQGLAHIGTNYGNSYPGSYGGLQNIVDAIAIYRSVVGIGRTFTFEELLSVYTRGERMYINGTTNSHIYTSGDASATGANPTSFFRWGRFDENGGLKMQFGADSGAKWELINKVWNKVLFSVDTSGNLSLAGTMTVGNEFHISHPITGQQVFLHPTFSVFGYNNAALGHPTYVDGYKVIIRSGANYNQTAVFNESGNVVLSGTLTASATYHSSDERLKTFEEDVEVDLEKLKALPKKYFHWTADADGKRQLGTSAQAVEKIFPELVSTDANDSKSVNYANLSIVALAAIDKLAEKNDKLAEQNTELSKKNAELERRLAKIEKLLNIE